MILTNSNVTSSLLSTNQETDENNLDKNAYFDQQLQYATQKQQQQQHQQQQHHKSKQQDRPLTSQAGKTSLQFTENQRIPLRCLVVTDNMPDVRIYLAQRDITSQGFTRSRSVSVSGRLGLRRMRYTTELRNDAFQPSAEDDGRQLKCVVYSADGDVVNSTSARIVYQCECNHSVCM